VTPPQELEREGQLASSPPSNHEILIDELSDIVAEKANVPSPRHSLAASTERGLPGLHSELVGFPRTRNREAPMTP
jgi:hypothetical protein